MTVKEVVTTNRTQKILLMVGSIFAGWGYLSQMEYFIGIEAFRFAAIMVLMWRAQGESFRQKITKIIVAILPFLLIAAVFFILL